MYEVEVDPGLHRERERPLRLERGRRRVPVVAREDAGAAPEFEVAWALHGRAVFERCLFLTSGRREDADEAFSRASFTAFQNYARHRRGIQNVRHWLLRLAHNVCMDLHRERARHARLRDLEPADSESIVAVDVDHRPVNPEASLLEDEQLAILHAAVEGLPERLRAPLALRLGEELPDRRIAEILGLTEPTVRKRLQEARAALRPALLAYRCNTVALTKRMPAASVQRVPKTSAKKERR